MKLLSGHPGEAGWMEHVSDENSIEEQPTPACIPQCSGSPLQQNTVHLQGMVEILCNGSSSHQPEGTPAGAGLGALCGASVRTGAGPGSGRVPSWFSPCCLPPWSPFCRLSHTASLPPAFPSSLTLGILCTGQACRICPLNF